MSGPSQLLPKKSHGYVFRRDDSKSVGLRYGNVSTLPPSTWTYSDVGIRNEKPNRDTKASSVRLAWIGHGVAQKHGWVQSYSACKYKIWSTAYSLAKEKLLVYYTSGILLWHCYRTQWLLRKRFSMFLEEWFCLWSQARCRSLMWKVVTVQRLVYLGIWCQCLIPFCFFFWKKSTILKGWAQGTPSAIASAACWRIGPASTPGTSEV